MQISTVRNLKTNKIERNMGISPLVDKFMYEQDLPTSSVPNPNYREGIDDVSLEEIQIPIIHQLRVCYQQSNVISKPVNSGQISITIIKEHFEKKIKINNTFDLHDYILNNVPSTDLDLNNVTQNNIDYILPIYVNRASNQIAMCSRRGAGNVCIINEKNMNLLNKDSIDISIDDHCFDYSNTYEYKGSIGGVKYYVDKTGLLSEDYVIVTYNGNITNNPKAGVQDAGLFAVVDSNSDVWLTELKNSANAFLGNFTDFFKVIKIKR